MAVVFLALVVVGLVALSNYATTSPEQLAAERAEIEIEGVWADVSKTP